MNQLFTKNDWVKYLNDELNKDYFIQLMKFLKNERKNKKNIFPPDENLFKAFELTALNNVKVVILGQDPYHGPGQAHGLSFSVPSYIKLPPSLKNIFKELETDLNLTIPKSGDLTQWAQQGVLLLNSVLSVEEGRAGSHQGQGWETFTDQVIQIVNKECQHVVFILWGSYAQKKAQFVDRKKHLVLESVHPSPLSSYRGFFGSKPFSKANEYLHLHQRGQINWGL